MVLQLDHCLAKRREVTLGDGRKDSQEYQPAKSFGDAIGQGGEIVEGLELLRTMPAPRAGRLYDQDRPIYRKRHPGNERRRVDLIAPAPVNDQPATEKTMEPDPGSAATCRECSQRLDLWIGITCEFQHDPNNGQAELGSNSEADMIRRRGNHLDPRGRDFGSICCSPGSWFLDLSERVPNSISQRAGGAPDRRGLGAELDARCLDHQPDASKLPWRLRTPAEQTEVKAARGSDAKLRHERAAVESR